MATLKIKIEGNRIVSSNGVYFKGISEDGLHAAGNGWEVTIRPTSGKRPGRIIAHCERQYSDGPAVCHREFRLEDGLLGLAGGNVYSRYAYFRKASFQKFLDEFGITAVKREDPNQTFTGFSAYSGWGTATQDVETDGELVQSYEDAPGSRERFESPGGNPNLYEGRETHTVTGATWAIVERKEDYRDNHNHSRILYTTVKDVTSLGPELRERKAREQRIERAREALGWSGKHFKTASEMRAAVEALAGKFPLTSVEKPGRAIRHAGVWNRYHYGDSDAEFTLTYPVEGIEGQEFDSLDQIVKKSDWVNVGYHACVVSGAIHLYAGHCLIGEVQL